MRNTGPYRHTCTLTRGVEGAPDYWDGDVTLKYTVYWGCSATHSGPAEGASVQDWRIVEIDRIDTISPPQWLEDLVGQKLDELEPDLISAAADTEAYYADQAADARREELRDERRWGAR